MIDVQKKTLLDIHKAIEAGKTGESLPLTGNVTVSIVDAVDCAGGMLSSPDEMGTLTLGEPYKTVHVEEDETITACSMQNYNFSLIIQSIYRKSRVFDGITSLSMFTTNKLINNL